MLNPDISEPSGTPRSHTKTIIAWFVVVCVAMVGAGVYYVYIAAPKQEAERTVQFELSDAKRFGDYEKALSKYDAIMSDPSMSAEQKGWATIDIVGVSFRDTGDVKMLLEDIRALKMIIEDTTVSARTRATAIGLMARLYNNSGRSPLVFAEIYKGEPYQNYLEENDPDLSAIKLSEWAFGLYPSSHDAIFIAQLASARYFLNPQQSAAETAKYADLAERYLQQAEALAQQEIATNPSYARSERYFTYLTWRPITIGRLVVQVGEPYKSSYRSEYADFFAHALERTGDVLAEQQLFFARFQFSRILVLEGDFAAAKEQLDLIATEMQKLVDPDARSFVWFLRNEHAFRREEPTWQAVETLFTVSPAFEAAVTSILVSA